MAIIGDNPITEMGQDTLGRGRIARSFAQQLIDLDASQGVVVGVLGAWGSGKTSLLNLARKDLTNAGISVLDFNPWMFSGTEQLVESFFTEVSAQLKMRKSLADIAGKFNDYGQNFSGLSWIPILGPWIARGTEAADLVARAVNGRSGGVAEQRLTIEESLKNLDKPIVVILDDIDRLSVAEVRDIFKLVRLTANFPNFIYVLAFDRNRVEKSLAEQGIPGRDYLEKILQIAIDLPTAPTQMVREQIPKAIAEALDGVDPTGPFDTDVWTDLFLEIIAPLMRNMRDVRRYAANITGTVRDLDGQIALTDVLALEALRILRPEMFACLYPSLEGLTTASGYYGASEASPHLKAQVTSLIESAKSDEKLAHNLIQRLFPAGERYLGGSHYGADSSHKWLRDRRVAHPDILRLYLERFISKDLEIFLQAEKAWTLASNHASLDEYLRSLDIDDLQKVISSLDVYRDRFTAKQASPVSIVLLNLLPEIPNAQQGMFDLDVRAGVTRIVYHLLEAVGDPDRVCQIIDEILPQLTTLSTKFSLIMLAGHRESTGHKLIGEAEATAMEQHWHQELSRASDSELAKEPDLFRILYFAKTLIRPDQMINVSNSPGMTFAVLKTSISNSRGYTTGSRKVQITPQLPWEPLINLYEDEATLRDNVTSLKDAALEGSKEVVTLAERYLSGWRPSLGDDD